MREYKILPELKNVSIISMLYGFYKYLQNNDVCTHESVCVYIAFIYMYKNP